MTRRDHPDVLTMIGDLLMAGCRVEFRPFDRDGGLCVAVYDRETALGEPATRCHYETTTLTSLVAAWAELNGEEGRS